MYGGITPSAAFAERQLINMKQALRIKNVKRVLSIALLCAVFLCTVSPLTTDAESGSFAMPEKLGGVENIYLAYTFNMGAANEGKQTVASLLPHVGYRDRNGTYTDTFMDSFLFLPCVTKGPSGGTMYRPRPAYGEKAAIASDWEAFVDKVCASGYNVEALNSAAQTVGSALQKDLSLNVFFSMLYPVKGQKNFGSLGGMTLDFSRLEDRKKAIKWMVDEQIARYNSTPHSNLKLAGFYWYEENLVLDDPDEKELLLYYNNYVHSLGYKSIWIPYYNATGWNRWKEYGFDVGCLQPNYVFNDSFTEQHVPNAISLMRKNGMCMEIEMDGNVFDSKYLRYLTYLREGVRSGVSEAIKMYYCNGAPGTLYYACGSGTERGRRIYELTYRYARGLLTVEEVEEAMGIVTRLVPEGYTAVSVGKPYTATKAYTNTPTDYGKVDGKELTDGIIGGDVLTTDWHAFQKDLTDPDGSFSITIDLQEVTHDLSLFSLVCGNVPEYGISLPPYVQFSVSDDNIYYRPIGGVSTPASDCGACLYKLKTDGVSARYIRATFRRDDSYYYVFCTEFIVGQKKILYGDADGSGVLTAYDGTLLLRYLSGSEKQISDCADMDRDGEIGAHDLVLLLQKLAELG